MIGATDYTIWRDHYGAARSAANAASVPEPSSMVLFSGVASGLISIWSMGGKPLERQQKAETESKLAQQRRLAADRLFQLLVR
jgi:hypothetical protein